MGGSSGGQVTGYRYFTNLLLFIGNPIEKMLGINFDKRGWILPFVDENGNALAQGVINSPNLYGENEGGVAGTVHVQYGRDDQEVLPFYKAYMDSKELPASAFPYQSYLAFPDFYVGNSGYMKEMLLWPKRIHVRNNGQAQWYDAKSEIINGLPPYSIGRTKNELDNFSSYVEIKNTSTMDFYNPPILVNENLSTVYRNSNIPASYFAGSYLDKKVDGSSELVSKFTFLNKFRATLKFRVTYRTDGVSVDFANTLYLGLKRTSGSGTDSMGDFKYIDFEMDFVSVFGLEVKARTSGSFDQDINIGANGFYIYVHLSSIDVTVDQVIIGSGNIIKSGDINPIHKIREILTDDTAMNKPETSVNNANFMKAADRIFDEGLGVSWSITEKSCIDAINELCYHIEAGIRVNRQTGVYEMVLFRDNWFKEDEIHTIAESKIKSMQYEITNVDEVINQVNVNFYDRENIKNSSFSISENGLIQTLNRVNVETLDFPYFMNMRNAEIVANWKLKTLSTGAIKGTFATGWREARKWNRYDLIRLPWSKRWTGTILVRIMNINLGGPTNNEVTIEFIEVVPATGMMNATIVIDDPIDKPLPPQVCNAKVFELPYFEAVQAFGEREVGIELAGNPEAGYLCAIAEKPQNNSLNAALYVEDGSGFERVATINYCETAYLDQAIDRISSSLVVKNVGNITSVRTGSQIFINDETMVYQSYYAETKILTVKRGAFGTTQNHTSNSILYFADDFIAVDKTLYIHGEVVNAKVLTTTPSGVLALDDAVNYEVDFSARAIRPYPPANVKINGEYFPKEIETDLILTWVDRNRLQQTGGDIIGWYEGNVTIEPGASTYLVLIEYDENNAELATNSVNVSGANTYTFPISSVQPDSRTIEITLKTLRDGYECLNPFVHIVELSQFFSEPYDITYEVSDL